MNETHIRHFLMKDKETLFSIMNDEKIAKLAGIKVNQNKDMQAMQFLGILNNNNYFAIANDKNEIIGAIFLFKLESKKIISYEIGYMLSVKYWNQKIMQKSLQQVVEKLKNRNQKMIILANVLQHNAASIAILNKIGFEKFQVIKEVSGFDNKLYSQIQFRLKIN